MPNGEEIFDEARAAEELEKERGVSRLEAAKEMAKRKAEEAIKKAAKKAAAKAIKALGRMLIKVLVASIKFLIATIPYWGPAVLILGFLFLITSVLTSGEEVICPEINGIENDVKSLYSEINGESNIYYPCERDVYYGF
jgi:hypothetical protein